MTRIAFAALFLTAVAFCASDRGKIYLDPNDSFTPYFTSALEKKNVPVTVTTDPKQAQYAVRFRTKNSDGSIVQGITTAITKGGYDSGAYDEVSMTVIDNQSKDVTFSYTCKKQNAYAADRMMSSVAECLAKHWKNKLK